MISGHVFHHRAFALFWTGKFLTTIATLTQNVAIGWQVYTVARLTHTIRESSFLVGMVGLAQFLPLFALALIAGEMADRHERRIILLCCTVLQLVSALAFVFQSLSPAPSLAGLFVTASFTGVARGFSMPAGNALAPTLVPQQILPQAVAWNTLSTQGGMVLGPWFSGLLCAIAPIWAYGFAAVLYFIAGIVAIALLAMKLDVRLNIAARRA